MKSLISCALVAIAIVITVALAPMSSWIFQNQWDLVAKGHHNSDVGMNSEIGAFVPDWLTNPETYRGEGRTLELAHVLYSNSEVRNQLLDAYNRKYPNDVLGWAVSVRRTCMMGVHFPLDPQGNPKEIDPKVLTRLKVGVKAAEAGEILEPTNGYFPLMKAEFLMELGDYSGMNAAIADAASKAHFSGHIFDEGLALEQAQVLAKGYRGELVKMNVDANILLPDYAHIKALSRYLNSKGSLVEKRDMIQTMDLMAREETTAIGMLVSDACVRILVSPPQNYYSSSTTPKDPLVRGYADKFDEQLKLASIIPPKKGTATIFAYLDRLRVKSQHYFETLGPSGLYIEDQSHFDQELLKVIVSSVAPYVVLPAVLISLGLLLPLMAGTRFDSSDRLTLGPYVIGLPVWAISAAVLGLSTESLPSQGGLAVALGLIALGLFRLGKMPATVGLLGFGLSITIATLLSSLVNSPIWIGLSMGCIFAGLPAWFIDMDQRTRFAPWLALIWTVLGGFTGDLCAVLVSLWFWIAFGFLWSRKIEKVTKISNGLLIGTGWLATVGIGFVLTMASAFNRSPNIGYVGSWIRGIGLQTGANDTILVSILIVFSLGIVLAILFLGRPKRLVQATLCGYLLSFAILYLVTCANDLRVNRHLQEMQANLLHEGQAIRKMADQSQ